MGRAGGVVAFFISIARVSGRVSAPKPLSIRATKWTQIYLACFFRTRLAAARQLIDLAGAGVVYMDDIEISILRLTEEATAYICQSFGPSSPVWM